MKRILAPTDGSSHSQKALAFAADLAKHYDAELLVAHVTNETRITDDDRRLVETEYASEIEPALRRAEAEVAGSVVGLPIAARFEYEATATAVGKVLGEQLLKSAEDYLRERVRHGSTPCWPMAIRPKRSCPLPMRTISI